MRNPADSPHPDPEDASSRAPGSLDLPVGEGDDDHLILWMLSLTPTERVEVAQAFVDSVFLLRNGLRT